MRNKSETNYVFCISNTVYSNFFRAKEVRSVRVEAKERKLTKKRLILTENAYNATKLKKYFFILAASISTEWHKDINVKMIRSGHNCENVIETFNKN